ncbi:peptidylprolyl isomerase [Cellulomonas bogoriensis]|uniref:Peptidylprolyl isomerase n=1 Tax=Cellulomonas bogoriensis 69B4 = DSM 16987 TaxID=1386082 RepID=A0A0A0C0H7_9CELL|nr:peptidylprolyl isomerase [Cellulomonas bogoriensis]KGM12924.1 peptidylprolyl isomerase [Cellulomonas bogoriensis 69B4 = DSM 16987]
MSTSKREREYARKRHEKWEAHQAEARARSRRRWTFVGALAGAVVLVGAVVLALQNGGAAPADDPEVPPEDAQTTAEAPDPALAQDRTWQIDLTTTAGDLVLELDGAAAPQAVASFITLAQDGYFTGTTCHRLTVEGIFVLQCGDPTGTGTGNPGYFFGPIENAPADDVYPAGTVAMARVGGDGESMGSQFFLVYADSQIPSDAAGGYSVFGRVAEGMDVLQEVAEAGIAEGTDQTPAIEVTIEEVETQ